MKEFDVLAQNKPGELARAMVNVDSIYILGKDGGATEIALTVDNIQKAQSVLKWARFHIAFSIRHFWFQSRFFPLLTRISSRRFLASRTFASSSWVKSSRRR